MWMPYSPSDNFFPFAFRCWSAPCLWLGSLWTGDSLLHNVYYMHWFGHGFSWQDITNKQYVEMNYLFRSINWIIILMARLLSWSLGRHFEFSPNAWGVLLLLLSTQKALHVRNWIIAVDVEDRKFYLQCSKLNKILGYRCELVLGCRNVVFLSLIEKDHACCMVQIACLLPLQ